MYFVKPLPLCAAQSASIRIVKEAQLVYHPLDAVTGLVDVV